MNKSPEDKLAELSITKAIVWLTAVPLCKAKMKKSLQIYSFIDCCVGG